MKKISETIIFFGNERLATGVATDALTLRGLIEAGYTIAAVVANHRESHSRQSRDLEIKRVADQHRIPLLTPARPTEIAEELRTYGADIGILVAYGRIVPQSIIDIFPKGILNIHPSLLPLHRGPTPIESVILEGAAQTGVSIMQLVQGMDAGPVYAQSTVILRGNETKQELADTLLDLGATMLVELLPDIIRGNAVALPQEDANATYDTLITKENGLIAWEKPAIQIEREIRAFAAWPGSYTTLLGKELIVTEATVVHETGKAGEFKRDKKSLIVFCQEDALNILKVKPLGKKEMPIAAFLAGLR